MNIEIRVKVLAHGEGLALPAYASEGAAGADLVAAVDARDPVMLAPLQRAAVPTGISIAIPQGYEAQVRPRSGFALKQGVTVLNAPGTIDWDYRGEVKVLLVNLSDTLVVIERGMRIAQLVVAPVTRARFSLGTLDETARGEGGFGSTGTHA